MIDINDGNSAMLLIQKAAQLAITCSKLLVETLGQGVKYVQS